VNRRKFMWQGFIILSAILLMPKTLVFPSRRKKKIFRGRATEFTMINKDDSINTEYLNLIPTEEDYKKWNESSFSIPGDTVTLTIKGFWEPFVPYPSGQHWIKT